MLKMCWTSKTGILSRLREYLHFFGGVPFRFIGKKVKLLYCASNVEVFCTYEHITMLKRMKSPCNYTIDREYITAAHRLVTEWTTLHFLKWAKSIHDDLRLYILKVLDESNIPNRPTNHLSGYLALPKKRAKSAWSMPVEVHWGSASTPTRPYRWYWRRI